ncbi:phage tail protein [Terasakiella pusilla]|uniref:phage tail protein n=1 Tax=Terasakiella pusilla TaxID=64973 RepID=UPI003AA98F30
MADPFLGSIKLFAISYFTPLNYADCNGQIMLASQNEALFSLFQSTYGGDGRTTFALPDLRGRVPLHANTYTYGRVQAPLGQRGGEEKVTLTNEQLPMHTHNWNVSENEASNPSPVDNALAKESIYTTQTLYDLDPLNSETLEETGGSASHLNMMPYLTIRFAVATRGIYPERS